LQTQKISPSKSMSTTQSLLQDPEYAVRSSCRMVSWSRSLSLCRVGVAVTCCATWGVAVTVVAPRGVLRSLLLRHMGCRRCGYCTARGVAVAVVAPRGVSPSRLLRRVGRRRRGLCAARGVTSQSLCRAWYHVAVVMLCAVSGRRLCATCGVAVTVVAPRGVSWSLHRTQCRGCCAAWGVAAIVPRAVSTRCHSCSHCAVCGIAVVGARGWPCVRRQERWWKVGECCTVRWKRKKSQNKYIYFLGCLRVCKLVRTRTFAMDAARS
jgi:hypothetical protein